MQKFSQRREYIYNENYEMVISTDVSSKYTFTTSGRNLYEGVAKILFDERENGYYYRHDNATPNLSVALGVKHYYLALEIANNDIDKAIRLYTLGHFEKDPDKLKGKDDYVDEVLGAMDGTLKY